ncbi:protein FAM156A/FAM156B-like [Lepus europaeus]|uniref:protein FAM156A/FAM156B-like n=1 Tax=Lepus europaeus TaxID=9983 RepID=UPI002B4909AB|nr:protein FAM156A/FAM156B-like [Lepus europaeus]
MDPVQNWSPGFAAEASPMAMAETSADSRAASQPPSTKQLMRGLGNMNPGAGADLPVPLPAGLRLQQQYREAKTQQRRYERLPLPQGKKELLGHMRWRHRDHRAPYPASQEANISPPGDRAQNRFHCECRYCQSHGPSTSGFSGERGGASWETLVQGFSGLSLSLGTSQPGVLPGGPLQQQQEEEREETCQAERQQESKRMFQRLLRQWLDEK